MQMLNNDQVSSTAFFFIGVMIVIASLPYELGGLHSPKTGFLPFVTGLTICLLSLIGFGDATLKRREGGKWKSIVKGLRWDKPLVTLISLVVYALVLNSLGFILTTTLLVGFLLKAIIPQRWSVVITGAILTPLVAYLVFQILLKTELPMGLLKF